MFHTCLHIWFSIQEVILWGITSNKITSILHFQDYYQTCKFINCFVALSLENKLILLHLFKKQLCWNLLKLLFRINTSQACVGGAIYSAMMGKEKKNTITKQISHYSTMILSCQTFHCWKTLSKKLIKADRFMKFVTLP